MSSYNVQIAPIVTYWDLVEMLDVNNKLRAAFRETADVFLSKRCKNATDIETAFKKACKKHHISPSTQGYGGFPGALCISINDCAAHGVPRKENKINIGDVVTIDATGFNGRYHSDLAETFLYVETATPAYPDQQHLMKATKLALDRAIRACKPGTPYCKLSNIISKTAREEGVFVVENLSGHGIGTKIHMQPHIDNDPCENPKDNRREMQVGDVVSIEPIFALGTSKTKRKEGDPFSIYTYDGSISAHYERNIIITDSGCHILNEWKE